MKKQILTASAIMFICISIIVSSVMRTTNASVKSADGSEYRVINYQYDDMGQKGRDSQFLYSDDILKKDKDIFNAELAKMCVALSVAAYNKDYINSVVDQMGFEVINDNQTYLYDKADNNKDGCWDFKDNDHVAYTIARSPDLIEGKTTYLVVVKGTSSNAEWYSDFRLGNQPNGFHEGFYKAARNPDDGVYSKIIELLAAEADPSKVEIILTGHSRGAAVANLTAGQLIESVSGLSEENVCAYTFACPAVGKNVDTTISSIFNINNPGDLITLLPLEEWGYKRYGKDIDVYQSETMKDNIYFQFSRITGVECASKDEPTVYTETIRQFIPNTEKYNSDLCQFIFRIIGMFMGSRFPTDFWEVVSYDLFAGPRSMGISSKNLKKAFDEGLINSIADFFVDYVENAIDFYCELVSFIDSNKAEVALMTEDEWKDFYTKNYYSIQSIEECTEADIETADDFINSRDTLDSLSALLNKTANSVTNLWRLFFGTDGMINGALTHGHTPTMYVATVNARCLGYQGWYLYQGSSLSNIKNDTNVLCDGNSIRPLSDGTLELGEDCSTIGAYCFAGSLFSGPVFLCESIKYMGAHAFANCSGLTGEVKIPEGITRINDYTFSGCSGIEKVIIPESVEEIGREAFR
ncbi:MAG: leucine-rich repeat protein, partial [Clostridiales bacterium]|nr:leucine-rich repeat protein [Clostridiales bacterium]